MATQVLTTSAYVPYFHLPPPTHPALPPQDFHPSDGGEDNITPVPEDEEKIQTYIEDRRVIGVSTPSLVLPRLHLLILLAR